NVAGVLTESDDGLLIRHAALVSIGVTKLIDSDDLIVGPDRLFVALELVVARDAVFLEIRNQSDDRPRTLLALRELGDALDHRVRASARELTDESEVARLAPQIAGPNGLLLVSKQIEVSFRH